MSFARQIVNHSISHIVCLLITIFDHIEEREGGKGGSLLHYYDTTIFVTIHGEVK